MNLKQRAVNEYQAELEAQQTTYEIKRQVGEFIKDIEWVELVTIAERKFIETFGELPTSIGKSSLPTKGDLILMDMVAEDGTRFMYEFEQLQWFVYGNCPDCAGDIYIGPFDNLKGMGRAIKENNRLPHLCG